MDNTRLILLLIILFVLLGVLIFVLWYFQNKQISSPIPEAQLSQFETSTLVTPTLESSPSSELNQTKDWQTYTNDKYGYSFKYPSDYNYVPCIKKPCKNFVYDKLSGYTEKDYVLLHGDISDRGWPNISVAHLNSDFYNPPSDTDLIEWLKDKSPNAQYVPSAINYELDGAKAVKVEVPASSQSYGLWLIYFIKDNKLFEIQLLDPSAKEAKDFYNLFLNNLQVNI